MKENTYVSIINDLANQLASKSINEAEFKVRLTESKQLVAQLTNEVESYRTVLASDSDLQELFEEIKNKNEVTN